MRRRWPWLAVAGVATAALLVVAVARIGQGGQASPGGQAISVQRAGGAQVGQQAAAFTATTSAGGRVTLPAGKPAVLLFMAAWCEPLLEASALDRIERQAGSRVVVLAVDVDPSEPAEDLRRFAGKVGARYGFVQDRQGALAAAFGVRALDSTVVLDAAGRIVYRDAAPTGEAMLRSALAKAGL